MIHKKNISNDELARISRMILINNIFFKNNIL